MFRIALQAVLRISYQSYTLKENAYSHPETTFLRSLDKLPNMAKTQGFQLRSNIIAPLFYDALI